VGAPEDKRAGEKNSAEGTEKKAYGELSVPVLCDVEFQGAGHAHGIADSKNPQDRQQGNPATGNDQFAAF
jgi:hypothetical protein